ncbi:hypothetical protein [Ruminococcus albus]|uniref:Uncharacterized protein n=1 Tax=Ruminococcus albus TaxID=1264 RepID=A0A1I1LWQ3_RUMAL|nr:hypothetical protein [Ruminococcus albus]SFC74753.1 hypothetical protein SAMN02910406_02318 [Ruminococcus albus]
MKFTYLFAVTAALILAGCGSFTERPADSDPASGDLKSQAATDAENSESDVSSEDAAESGEVISESSIADSNSEASESRGDTPDESIADGKVGLFTGGLDDDGRGDDEEHFGLETGFAPGIWWSFCDSGDMYYEFATDGTGMRVYQADGFKEGFTYEMDDGCAVFSFAGNAGGTSEKTRAKAEERGGDAVLTFEDDNHTEELVYMGNIGFDEFTFFNNNELEEMAREYYKQHNDTGYVPEFCDILKPEENNDIVIRLFDIVGNNTSTANWYYIDRFTGKGKDMMDNEIDLTTVLKG